MLYNSIEDLIGNTPILKISPKVHGLKNIDLYAKLEYYNPFGSVKDRIAKSMLEEVINEQAKNNNNLTILESSSGNTGKALVAICNLHNLPFKMYTNRLKIPEQRKIMQVLGADIEELPGFSECPDPTTPESTVAVIERQIASDPTKYYYPNQYFNPKNLEAHYLAGEEISQDLGAIDYYFGFLGTTGSTRGAGMALKKKNPQTKVIGVISESHNHIPGGREAHEMWEVGLFDKDFYSDIVKANVNQAIDGMLTLTRQCGIMCGPTSGANYMATVNYLKGIDLQHNKKKEKLKAVFIVCDRIELYLSYIEKYRPEIFGGEKQLQQKNHSNPALVVPTLTPASLSSELGEFKTIIDIRTSDAYQLGHITGAINIREDVLADLIDKPFLADGKVVVYCRKGSSSKQYVSTLKSQGYDAYSLDGGIQSWVDQGYDLTETFGDCDMCNKDLK